MSRSFQTSFPDTDGAIDGASLIYTIPSVPSPLRTLIHSSLGIHSLLKKQPLKHNVIDRDKVVLPPNWDSWGKIRVLREGFDVEGVNQGWSVDIDEFVVDTNDQGTDDGQRREELIGAVAVFEETIRDPGVDLLSAPSGDANGQKLDIQSLDPQAFLVSQLEALDRIKLGADSSGTDNIREPSNRKVSQPGAKAGDETSLVEGGRVNEHIGPVQFNMGGIQVDADDMLQRLKASS